MRTVLVALCALVALAAPVAADEPFPTRPITIVNAFPPGGLADITARPLAAAMERILKQPVVVVNKPGASGAISPTRTPTSSPRGGIATRARSPRSSSGWARPR